MQNLKTKLFSIKLSLKHYKTVFNLLCLNIQYLLLNFQDKTKPKIFSVLYIYQ